jgi:asparagine synthase (glutamine-hydrolysing)
MIFTQLHIRGMAWSERTYARYGLCFADPFSDRRLVDLALAVPQAVINRPGDQSKPLMRAAMRGTMPEEARRRVDKVVPSPLYDHALRHQASSTVRELLTRPRVAEHGWVDAQAWRDHYESWLAGQTRLQGEWWRTLGIEIWLRQHW